MFVLLSEIYDLQLLEQCLIGPFDIVVVVVVLLLLLTDLWF